ncbi:MAG: hypothetical protein SPL80_04620 [Bacilli bacterium]|nr:hypothetical protein [Bacilli bacterium]
MIHTKARIIALSSVVIAAIGCFIGVSTSSEHFTELTVATASAYTAEINSSTHIIKALDSDQVFGFQLHGGENYGQFAQKSNNSIEVHDSGDYVISIVADGSNENYIDFFLNSGDSSICKVGEKEYKTFYAIPGLQTITVTVDAGVTNCKLYGCSGAQNSFDSSEETKNNLKMYTLTRNSTPLPDSSSSGNHISLSRIGNGNEPLKIRSISITYNCGH